MSCPHACYTLFPYTTLFRSVLAPFFLLFMLKDHEKFVPFITQFFSGERKKWVKKTIKDVDSVLSAYIQGQLLISTILDRKSTRLNSSHVAISYAVVCLKKIK